SDERWQQRRNEAAEDPEREREQERKRDQLRPDEIVLDSSADLLEADHAAPEHDGPVALKALLEPLRGLVARLVVGPPQERDLEPPAPKASATAASAAAPSAIHQARLVTRVATASSTGQVLASS